MAKQGRGERKGSVSGGIKALVSISALTATLVGWGLLAKDAQQEEAVLDKPADVGALLQDILGPLPNPVAASNDEQAQGTGLTLRPVSLPAGAASGPAPVTRTQSSR